MIALFLQLTSLLVAAALLWRLFGIAFPLSLGLVLGAAYFSDLISGTMAAIGLSLAAGTRLYSEMEDRREILRKAREYDETVARRQQAERERLCIPQEEQDQYVANVLRERNAGAERALRGFESTPGCMADAAAHLERVAPLRTRRARSESESRQFDGPISKEVVVATYLIIDAGDA